MSNASNRKHTLALLTVLHFFTHLYHVALLPLFLKIQDGFKLANTEEATLLLTVLMLAYYAPSYMTGVLADRLDRKKLLAIGLALNGLGFIGLALAHTYSMAIISVVVAGLGGSVYHPSGMALVADLFHGKSGRAFGIVGIGGGAGFFLGPLYTGWRADMTGNWQIPILELGVVGVAASILFYLLENSMSHSLRAPQEDKHQQPIFPNRLIWIIFLVAICTFALRDIGGNGVSTLGSLFLQKSHGWDLTQTGFALSLIFLAAIISNPLFGHLSDLGNNRGKWIIFTLTIGAVTAVFIPRVSTDWTIPVFIVHGFFFMACYPLIESLMMETVSPKVRGRVVGIYLTISGGVGTLAHWLCGYWVDRMDDLAFESTTYYSYYMMLAGLMLTTLIGVGCLNWIRCNRTIEQSKMVA